MVRCCILGCPNNRSHNREITYHIFPNPVNDKYRHMQWIKVMNNPRIHSKSPLQVYKLYRVCRLHFAADSFNGICKRLLNSAIPTMHLNLSKNNLIRHKRNVITNHSIDMVEVIEEDNKINFLNVNYSDAIVEKCESNGSSNNSDENSDYDDDGDDYTNQKEIEYIFYEDDNDINLINDTEMTEENAVLVATNCNSFG